MKNMWKKLVVACFVFALIFTGTNMLAVNGNKAYAAEETEAKYYVKSYSASEVKDYKDANSAPILTPNEENEEGEDGKHSGWIFAGWFTAEDCETALTGDPSALATYYAKFVPSEVFSVKAQVKSDVTKDSEKTDLRLVATVDSLRYKSVGFEVYYDGATTPIKIKTTSVFSRIEAAADGVEYGFSPNIFDSQSEYFVTATLTNIANKNFGKSFYIRPYVETLDGTISYGVSRYARVEDSYLNIVNVPVRVNADSTTGAMNVEYDITKFTYLSEYASTLADGTETTTPGYANGNVFANVTINADTEGIIAITGAEAGAFQGEVAHLRFKMKNATLPKNNEFTVKENGALVATCVYNYFAISASYSGTPDTSWYDANEDEFIITTAEELYGLASLVNAKTFTTQTVYLGSNIVVNQGTPEGADGVWGTGDDDWTNASVAAGLKNWTPIAKQGTTKFAGTFDGQGHTISGIYASQAYAGVALFGEITTGAYVGNLKLVDSYFTSGSKSGAAAICGWYAQGTFENIYSDAYVKNTTAHAGGLTMGTSGTTLFKNCWFAGEVQGHSYVGGITGFASGDTVTIESCLFTGKINVTSGQAGGIVGRVVKPVVMSDTLSTGTVTINTSTASGAIAGWIGTNGSSVGSVTCTNVYSNSSKLAYTVSSGHIFTGAETVTNLIGVDGYNNTELDFENYWVIRQSATPVLKSWCESGALYIPKTDWTGAGTEKSPYVITTPEQLYGLAQTVNAGETYEGKYFKLGADIRINTGNSANWETTAPKYNWIPIGSSTTVTFKGHFNATGSVREVKGLYVNTPTTNHGGLFGSVTNGSVKNIKVTNSYIKGASFVAAISGFTNAATIENVYTNATVVGASTAGTVQVAGIVGYQVKGTVRNAWFDGAVTGVNSSQYVGGVVGRTTDGNGAVIDNCLATGTVTSGRTSGNAYVGGILGGATRNTTVSNCFVALKSPIATAGATACVGSVVGGSGTSGYTLTVKDSYAASGVASKAHGTGGAGTLTGTSTVLTAYTGGNAYLNTYLEFDRHEDALPESEQHDGIWVAREGKAPGLKSFVAEEDRMELVNQNMYRADKRWYNTTDTVFTIDSAEELVGLASLVNAGTDFNGKTIKVGKDIVVNNGKATDWSAGKNNSKLFNFTPIAAQSTKKYFAGTFDGQGNSIEGLYINLGTAAALFGQTAMGSTVKNLRMLNSYITGNQGLASIGGWYCYGTFDTIYSDAIIYNNSTGSTQGYYGGIIGLAGSGDNSCTIRNCWFDGKITANRPYAGGIAASVNGTNNVLIENCLNTGTIKATSQVGGLVGRVAVNFDLKDSLNVGSVSGSKQIGNIIGYTTANTVEVDCERVYTLGSTGILDGGLGTLKGTVQGVDNLTGANGFLNTWLTFDRPELPTPTTGKWVAIEGKAPVLKSFVEYADGERLALNGQNMYRVDTRWYNADETEFTIYTMDELIGLASIVDGGNQLDDVTICLGADIIANNGNATDWAEGKNTSDLYPWESIGEYLGHTNYTKTFYGDFDGKGHTISGLYTNEICGSATTFDDRWGVGLFAKVGEGATIKDFKLLNSYMQGSYRMGAIVGQELGATIDSVYTDAILKCHQMGGGIVGLTAGTVNNCWFDGQISGANYVGGITSYNGAGTTISNCLNTGGVKATSQEAGGFVGRVAGNISIQNCVSDGTVTGTESGSIIGELNSGTVTASNVYVLSSANANTVGKGTVPSGIVVAANLNNYKGYMNTTLDFDNTWVAMEESAPRLQIFAPEEGRFDTTSWFTKAVADENENAVGTEANPYIIDSLADLYGFTKRVKDGNTFEGQYIKLTQSITANDVEKEGAAASWATEAPYYVWSPIGGNPNAFKGNFDGGMNTISGLYATGSYGTTKPAWYTGLFGYVNGATIKNIRVEDSYFYAEYYTAGVVGYVVDGTVDSVYSNATTVAKTGNAAVVVGAIANGTIQNSWADGNATAPKYAGGITSFATTGTITIQHCLNTGDVTATTSEAGGIVGRGASATLTIADCLSIGTITAPTSKGSVVGYLTVSPVIESCYGYSSNGAGAGGEAVKLSSLEDIYDAEAYERLNAGYWAARVGNYPVPAVFATGADYATAATKNAYYVGDTTFATDESGAYLISSAAELYGLASLSQSNSFEGTTFKLTNDITINHQTLNKNTTEETSYEWLPIGSESVPFKGTFNGQGYTISGLYKAFNNSHDTKRWTGLFDTIEGGVVENLNIENTYFTYVYNGKNADPSRIGSVAGYGGGTFRNIRSTASLVNDGRGTGGIIGQTITDTTISNCWFDGKAICETTTQSSYLGGLIGFATIGGNVVIEHSHVSGDVLGGSYHVGGLVGNIQGAVQATITDSMFNGNLKASYARKGDVFQHGQIVGTVVANSASTTAGKGPSLTVSNCYGVNDFASYDIGAAYADSGVTLTPTVSGSGNVSVKADRLIGYAGNTAGLDYTNYWTLTKNGTPQLATFTSASDKYDGSQLTSLFKLDTVGKTLANAEDVGAGRYTVKLTGKALEDYNAYCEALDAGSFDAWGNDQSSDLNAEGVYNKVFTNADNWVVNVSYMEKTKVLTITVSSVDTLSKHLKASSITAYTAEDGYTTSGLTPTFSMVEQKYTDPASSYVIQLSNGHFIVIDGGINNEAPYLMEYLESLVPEGKKPIIEAWVISHAHMDHMDVFRGFYSNLAKYQGKLYIEGIYFSEANDRIMSTVNAGEEDGHHHYLAYFKQVGSMFKTTTGAEPQVYRMYTGQRFTFDTVVMDVMLANEQFTWNDYVRAGNVTNPSVFNETSTWTMFTINGKKLLTAGDSNYIGKEFVVDNYSTDYLTVDIFTALHHGENINREQPSYSMKNDDFSKAITVKGAVFYSYPTDWYKETSKTTVKARIKEFMELQQDRGMTGFATTYESGSVSTDVKGYFYHGQGTVVLTFGESITANVKAKNDWVNSYTE